MTPLAAAELLRLDYREPDQLRTLARMEIEGVSACIVKPIGEQPTLIITGTDTWSDWWTFNLALRPTWKSGDTRVWGRGFWRHSVPIYGFAKGWLAQGGELGLIAGHSLGAAAAQIVGPSLSIPVIGFAAPRPLLSGEPPEGHELVDLYCRTDDVVARVPPWGSHVGRVHWIKPKKKSYRVKSHLIEQYIAGLKEGVIS